MMRWILFKVCFLSLFFSTGCVIDTAKLFMSPGPYQGVQDSCGFSVEEHSGEGVRWKKSKFPVTFKIHTKVPIEAEKNFIAAVDHWNLAWAHYLEDKGLEPFDLYYVDRRGVYEGNAGPDGNNLFLFVHEDFSKYDSSSVQAITSLRINKRTANIEDTDILVNRENFKFFYDPSYNNEIELAHKDFKQKRFLASLRTPSPFVQIMNKIKSFFNFFLNFFKKAKPVRQIADYRARVPRDMVDFPSLMIHELGHVPGRGHFNDDEYHTHFASREQSRTNKKRSKSKRDSHLSVMEPELLRGHARRDITEYDLENLFCAYYNY